MASVCVLFWEGLEMKPSRCNCLPTQPALFCAGHFGHTPTCSSCLVPLFFHSSSPSRLWSPFRPSGVHPSTVMQSFSPSLALGGVWTSRLFLEKHFSCSKNDFFDRSRRRETLSKSYTQANIVLKSDITTIYTKYKSWTRRRRCYRQCFVHLVSQMFVATYVARQVARNVA